MNQGMYRAEYNGKPVLIKNYYSQSLPLLAGTLYMYSKLQEGHIKMPKVYGVVIFKSAESSHIIDYGLVMDYIPNATLVKLETTPGWLTRKDDLNDDPCDSEKLDIGPSKNQYIDDIENMKKFLTEKKVYARDAQVLINKNGEAYLIDYDQFSMKGGYSFENWQYNINKLKEAIEKVRAKKSRLVPAT